MISNADRNDIEQALRKVLGPVHDFSIYESETQPSASYAMCMDTDGRTHSFILERQQGGWLLDEVDQ